LAININFKNSTDYVIIRNVMGYGTFSFRRASFGRFGADTHLSREVYDSDTVSSSSYSEHDK